MRHPSARTTICFGLTALLAMAWNSPGAIPPPERLLPDDTLILLTAPDFAKLRAVWEKLPQRQLWNDPSMKTFRDDFATKWKEQFVKPLERDLDIKLEDYTSLPQGQVTFALVQNGGEPGEQGAGMLLLVDTKDKSGQLKKNLAALRKKWVDSGKPLKTIKIRDNEFTVLPLSTNDVPKTLRKFFPRSSETHELGEENNAKPAGPNEELVIGQVDSLLVLSSTTPAAEKLVARLGGGSTPALADLATYQADHAALFRETPIYGWVNLKALVEVFMRRFSEKKDNPDAPNPFDIKPEKILTAIGVTGLKSLAFNLQQLREGSMVQVFIGTPESGRQGLLKILAGEPREARPPPFVPADAVKFQRWRIDGQKTWETLQKMIAEVSPQWLNGINFLLETANTAAKEKEPGFDIKKNLIGNIGDDLISYEKSAGKSATPSKSPPSLFLLGSPNAEALAAALKSILVFAGQQPGAGPEQREFLGRKIYSVALKGMMVPLGASGANVPQTLHYAATGGYVAFSSDASLVEEYLRSTDSQKSSLRETPGLAEAAQKVSGPGSSLFGYENQLETRRALIEFLRKNGGRGAAASTGAAANLLPSPLNVPATVQSFKDLMDFSLLPPFDSIAKYFHFSVYGGSASVEGLTFKWFEPVPPGVKP